MQVLNGQLMLTIYCNLQMSTLTALDIVILKVPMLLSRYSCPTTGLACINMCKLQTRSSNQKKVVLQCDLRDSDDNANDETIVFNGGGGRWKYRVQDMHY